MSRVWLLILLFLSLLLSPVVSWADHNKLTIINQYPHDNQSFTQGLLAYKGHLYESTGLYGHSKVQKLGWRSQTPQKTRALDAHLFGEGLARIGDKLYQLTWRAGIGLIYNLHSLQKTGSFRYAGQGWGLTFNGRYLIRSDGSDTLYFISPKDFHQVKTLQVSNGKKPVKRINELEYIDDKIWANIRYKDQIMIIDPQTGQVSRTIDASHLRNQLPKPNKAGVLNGIAWDADRRRLYLTGKNWPLIFEVRVEGVN